MERQAGTEIVKELEYLPLAIEQAAAYVREVTAGFSAYSEKYRRNRKDLHMWTPVGNRQYLHWVATTWIMSFDILEKTNKHAATLLLLFSFLNPDVILIQFLTHGVGAFHTNLRHVVLNVNKLATL